MCSKMVRPGGFFRPRLGLCVVVMMNIDCLSLVIHFIHVLVIVIIDIEIEGLFGFSRLILFRNRWLLRALVARPSKPNNFRLRVRTSS